MSNLQAQHVPQRTADRADWLEKWDGHMADDVGATNGVTPLAFLAATHDELVISGTRGTFRLPRNAIRRIGRGKFYPWMFRAIRIHHTVDSFPRDLQFKPMHASRAEILAHLGQLGFPVG